jgi:hypothetical protein
VHSLPCIQLMRTCMLVGKVVWYGSMAFDVRVTESSMQRVSKESSVTISASLADSQFGLHLAGPAWSSLLDKRFGALIVVLGFHQRSKRLG